MQMMGTFIDITQNKSVETALEIVANQDLKTIVEAQAQELKILRSQLTSEIARHQETKEQLHRKTSELTGVLKLIPDFYLRLDVDGNVLDYQSKKIHHLYIPPGIVHIQEILDYFTPAVKVRFQAAIDQVLTTNSLTSFSYTLTLPEGNSYFEVRLSPFPEQQILVLVRDVSKNLQNAEGTFPIIAQREALLNRLLGQIRASLELNSILETAVQEIQQFFQIDRCYFVWYHKNAEIPYWEAATEAKHPHLNSLLNIKVTAADIGTLGLKTLNKEIIQIDHVETDCDPIARQFFQQLGFTAFLSLPIHTQCGEIGAFACGYCSGFRPWLPSEVELLKTVTDQLAIAIDQATLYKQSRIATQIAEAKAQQLEATLQELSHTQAQLIQTEKMSSLGQLVAGVAHEINNPVNFIYGNICHASEYIKDLLDLIALYQQNYSQPLPEIRDKIKAIDLDFLCQDLPKILHSMNIGAERIRQIVLSLRNFSRLDETAMKPVNIHEGIDNTLLLLQYRLKPKPGYPEIKIVKEYGNLPSVSCYAAQLNQVFMNLLANAIDALEESVANGKQIAKPIIHIRTQIKTAPSGSDRVVITIADNGPGMTPEVREHLFETFFTTKPIGKGTGIGLSISYQIIAERHHGELQCFSTPGQGAEFVIIIPLIR